MIFKHFKSNIDGDLILIQPIKSYTKQQCHSSCGPIEGTQDQQHVIALLLNSPYYLTHKHGHATCPALQLVEWATKQTFARKKCTADNSFTG